MLRKKKWLRVVLVMSLDGRITPAQGGKASIGGKGDRKVLEESLAWSDGTLIGARTLEAHQNTCLIHDKDLIASRHRKGKGSQPTTIVVSSKKEFPQSWSFFQQPIHRWLLSPNSAEPSHCMPTGFDYQLFMSKSWKETLNQLDQKGLSKLVILGGSHLVSSLLSEDQIDELQLTFAPKILGGSYAWVPLETQQLPEILSKSNAWTLQETLTLENNEIMLRYIRNRSCLEPK